MKDVSKIFLPVLKGALLVLIGTIAILRPSQTITVMTNYFGVAVGLRGIFLCYKYFTGNESKSVKKFTLFNGLMDIVFGLILIVHPKITLQLLPLIIGIWAILSGLLESAIAATLNLRKSWPRYFFGVVILTMGWVILLHPTIVDTAILTLFGGLLIFMGLGYILISLARQKL